MTKRYLVTVEIDSENAGFAATSVTGPLTEEDIHVYSVRAVETNP